MNIEWYPGHMEKLRKILDTIKADLVLEVLDARIPLSSRNPLLQKIQRDRLIILNKEDLADRDVTNGWLLLFAGRGENAVSVNSRDNKCRKMIIDAIWKATANKRERLRARGIVNKPMRVMVVGIPNCGKSSIINLLASKKSVKTGNKPGITKSNQWIRLASGLELLDTPGILWPKLDEFGLNLAICGAVKDEIMNTNELAEKLLEILQNDDKYRINLMDRYGTGDISEIARKRLFLLHDNELDLFRAANTILDEFRTGKLGRISLERGEM